MGVTRARKRCKRRKRRRRLQRPRLEALDAIDAGRKLEYDSEVTNRLHAVGPGCMMRLEGWPGGWAADLEDLEDLEDQEEWDSAVAGVRVGYE